MKTKEEILNRFLSMVAFEDLPPDEMSAILSAMEEYASQFREPSTQGGEEKSIRDWGGEEIKLRSRIQVLEEALKQIRHKTYSRDTDDSILYEIDSVLTEAGFPYQSED